MKTLAIGGTVILVCVAICIFLYRQIAGEPVNPDRTALTVKNIVSIAKVSDTEFLFQIESLKGVVKPQRSMAFTKATIATDVKADEAMWAEYLPVGEKYYKLVLHVRSKDDIK